MIYSIVRNVFIKFDIATSFRLLKREYMNLLYGKFINSIPLI